MSDADPRFAPLKREKGRQVRAAFVFIALLSAAVTIRIVVGLVA